MFTFDPAIEAQRRAAQRGLKDTLQDIKTTRHYGKRDLAQALRDIRTDTTRNRQDILTSSRRGQQKLGFEAQDVQLKADRTNQDFDKQLANIGRQFAQLGHRQREGANAAGVLGGGTEAAATVARSQNQGLSEAPIHAARGRLDEDLATALSRIGIGSDELGQDTTRSLGRLTTDRDRDRRLSRRETGRTMLGLKREGQRAIREAAISDVDLITQEIYQARQNRPGAFTKTGRRRR